MNAQELKRLRQWQAAWARNIWRKDIEKDTRREMDMDEIRLNKKEGE